MKEHIFEQTARIALQKCLGKIPFLQVERIESPTTDLGGDLQAWVSIGDRRHLLLVQIKNNGQPRLARLAAYELKDWLSGKINAYGVFIAPYISPQAGKICEAAGIGYLDLAGNCLLSFGTIYIHQTGAPNPKAQKRDLRSLYSPKAERILRILLNETGRSWKMAELSQAAEVSLGQVANIKKLLLDREWLEQSATGIRLSKPDALLAEWAAAYNFQRNQVQEYYALAELPEIETLLADACLQMGFRYALAGFSSAARIAPMVRYQKASAYVSGDVNPLIERLKWKAVSSGANISFWVPYDDGVFYGAQEVAKTMITGPVQTYLDLQHYSGRGQEAAQAVYKEIEKTW